MMALDLFFDRRVLVFNFLPSLTLHRSRWPDFSVPPGTVLKAATAASAAGHAHWHRHWSRHILTSRGLRDRPAMQLDDPALPLAILPSAALADCARRLGVVLTARRLRRVIAREQVESLESVLGKDVFALSHPGWGYPTMDDGEPPFASSQEALDAADGVGTAALCAALKTADELIWQRAELKVPRISVASVLDGPAALDLALRLMRGMAQP